MIKHFPFDPRGLSAAAAYLRLVARMRALAVLAFTAAAMSVSATQTVDPPVNTETIVGVWEALWCQDPATLWRMGPG